MLVMNNLAKPFYDEIDGKDIEELERLVDQDKFKLVCLGIVDSLLALAMTPESKINGDKVEEAMKLVTSPLSLLVLAINRAYRIETKLASLTPVPENKLLRVIFDLDLALEDLDDSSSKLVTKARKFRSSLVPQVRLIYIYYVWLTAAG